MNDRLQNGALAGLLVLTLVLVGFSLRSRGSSPAPADARPTTSSASATPTPTPTRAEGPVVFLGDSVTEGKSATAPGKRWTALVARSLGLKEVNLGHARTGYLRIGPEGSCGDAACPSFKDSIKAVVAARPSTVIVTGGGNDTGLPADDVSAAVTATLSGLKKALPDAKIYVVNPWWDLRPLPESLDALTTTVSDAAKATGTTYLDTEQPLVDKPELMVASGTNPNDAGHAALARAVTQSMKP
ncbi:SGNH/GDSL hydrolase family protein [Knoellia sp. LjRoot47]|uniref:SGNH/GDSL hydrolase family protein n=1 Tax=Knoellia sp. LjRoot47 TaxID=3342330 RepID=UPI003ED0AEF6